MAEGSDSFNTIRKRDTVYQLAKRLTVGIAIQSHQIEGFPVVFHNAPCKGNERLEKMRFVYDDNIKPPERLVFDIIQADYTTTGDTTLVMRDHVVLLPVAIVACVLQDKNAHSYRCVPTDDAQNAGRLARKHRT